jgi:hypothetical protein
MIMGFLVGLAVLLTVSAVWAGVPCTGTSQVWWTFAGGDTGTVGIDTIDVYCLIKDCYGRPLGNRVCTFFSDRGAPYDEFPGSPVATDSVGAAQAKATSDSMGAVEYYVNCEGVTIGPAPLPFYWCTPAGIYDRPGEIPGFFGLWPAYPNPFHDMTDLAFAVPVDRHVSIQVYDVLGRSVSQLADRHMAAGYHTVSWDGCDSRGQRAAAGIYYAVMVTEGFSKSVKLVLLQ